CFDLFNKSMSIRASQHLYDKAVLGGDVICVHRLSCNQSHGILFHHRLIYIFHCPSTSLWVFLYSRYFKILLVCPMNPEQRQRFPARYSLISSSVGSVSSFFMANMFIINPGLQNPHCSAPSPARKLPNSSAFS